MQLLRIAFLGLLFCCCVFVDAEPWPEDTKFAATDRRNTYCDRQSEIDSGTRNFKDGLRGLEVSVVMHVDAPGWAERLENGTLAGLHIRLLDLVAERAGFTWHNSYAIVEMPDTLNTNETWTSWLLWGAENYDVVLEWFNDKPSRRSLGVTFSHHFLDQSLYVVAQKSQKDPPLSKMLFQFVEPFDQGVWLVILGSVVVTGVVYTTMEARVGDDFAHYQEAPSRKVSRHNLMGAMRHGFYLSFGSITGAGDLKPHSNFGKLFKCSWALVAFFILSTYTANLASFLFDRTGWTFPVNGIKDANLKKLSLCVQAGSSNEEHLKDVYQGVDIFTVDTAVSALTSIRDNKCVGAVVGNSEWQEVEIDEEANGDCDMSRVGQPFKRWGASWGTKSDSGVRCSVLVSEIFSLHLQEIEKEGILETEFEKYLISRSKRTCPDEDQEVGGAQPLTVSEVGGIYIIHVAFCVLCLIGHLNDRAYHRIVKNKRRKRLNSMDSYMDPHSSNFDLPQTPVHDPETNGNGTPHRLLPPPDAENGSTYPVKTVMNGENHEIFKEQDVGKDYPVTSEKTFEWMEVPCFGVDKTHERRELERQSKEIEALRGQMTQMVMDNAKMIRMLVDIDSRLGGSQSRNKVVVTSSPLAPQDVETSTRNISLIPVKSSLQPRDTVSGWASFDSNGASAALGFQPDFSNHYENIPVRVFSPPGGGQVYNVGSVPPMVRSIDLSSAPDMNLVNTLVRLSNCMRTKNMFYFSVPDFFNCCQNEAICTGV